MTAAVRLRFPPQFLLWIGVAVLIGVIAWLKTINVLLLIAYLLAAVLLVNLFLAARMVRRVTAKSAASPPVYAGESVRVAGEVRNVTARPVVIGLREASGAVRKRWFLPALPPNGTTTFATMHAFAARGRWPVHAIEAHSGYPFGIVEWSRVLTDKGEQVVLPALGALDLGRFRRWLFRSTAVGDSTRRIVRRASTADGDVRGLRAYRAGDPPRDVHWRTTARRGQLMVREYDHTAPQDLVVIVDPWVPSVPTDKISAGKVEWALSVAATVAAAWANSDHPGDLTILCYTAGGWKRRTGNASALFARVGCTDLADAVGATDVPALPKDLLHAAPRALRLVVSSRANSPLAEQLRAARLAAAVADPGLKPDWYAPPAPN